MVYTKESDFEEDLIKVLSTKGWERDVIKYPTEKDLLENLGVTEAQFDGIVNDRLELFKETDLVKVEPGQEYKETSDSTENEKTGQFVDEDGVYKIVRRALINKDENGNFPA